MNCMRKLEEIHWGIYLPGFVLLAVLLRVLSFHYSVIDHDESTYMVIAQELLKGKILYVDVWDTKPIGIFLLFAGIIKVFGHSIFIIRLFAAVFIGLTAGFLFLSIKRWGKKHGYALLAALLYIVSCSVHKWNYTANTEIFFLLFTAIALFFFSGKKCPKNFFLSGLFVGLGFVIKYFVLFDIAAFWIFYLVFYQKVHKTKQILLNTFSMGVGFILPFASVFVYYYLGPHFDVFAFASFELPLNYVNGFNPGKAISFFLEYHLVYAPFVFLFIVAIIKGNDKNIISFGVIWYLLVWIIVLLPGKFFHHYYFQLVLPMAFIAPEAFNTKTKTEAFINKHKIAIVSIFITAFLIWNIAFQYTAFIKKHDQQRVVAEYLNVELSKKETIYCNYSSIIYYLTKKSPPQKYIHNTLMSKQEHIDAIGVNVDHEAKRILKAEPDVMVIKGNPHPYIARFISENYTLQKIIEEEVSIYNHR